MTSSPKPGRDIPREVEDALALFFDNQATPEVCQAIHDWLEADPNNASLFAEYGTIERMIYDAQKTEDASAVFALLQEAEDNAEPDFSLLHAPVFEPPSPEADPGSLSDHDLVAVTGYALRLALTSKPAKRIYAYVGVAAAVLLAFVLLSPWDDSEEPTDVPFAQDPPVQPVDVVHVATLTAEHDAVWASDAPSAGDPLSAGQRLTLTAGFAEITTHRGAIAILEAPATIELLDNNNAIRLHAGKLVGICETDASKGFLVRTPHMDITDLGTRFGISADTDETEVHVFEGEVQAERVDTAADTLPTLLAADQSARTSADTDVIARIDHRTDRFAALLPTTTQLPGTGHGLAVGETDPNWQIVAIDGQPLDQPQLASVSGLPIYTNSIPNDPQRSQWLSWNPGRDDAAIYTFRTTVELPDGADPTARIDVRYVADNQLRAIIVNGHRIERESGPIGTAWIYREARLQEHLRPGENTIEFEVANIVVGGRPAGELALKVQWQLTTTPGLRNTEQSRPQ